MEIKYKILKWIRNEDRIHVKAVLQPVKTWVEINELLASHIQILAVPDDDRRQTWEIYEKPKEGVAYLLTVDTAAGAADPSGAGDNQAAYVTRKPESGEGTDPIMCAAIRSTMEIIPFTRVILNACRLYNNATLCPESPSRGATNATFFAYIKSWLFWFKMAITSDTTGVSEDKPGFATSPRTRDLMFEVMADYIARHDAHSRIFHEYLLKELAACEWVTKNGRERPDHPREGSLDCVTAWGMALFCWKFGSIQMQCNGRPGEPQPERRTALGLILDRLAGSGQEGKGKNPFSNMD